MTGRGAHPDPEIVAAFVDGRLDPAERAVVEEHLADCADCREWVAGAASAAATAAGEPAPAEQPPKVAVSPPLRRARPGPRAEQGSRRRGWRRVAIAAAAILVLATGLSIAILRSRPPSTRVEALVRDLPPASRLVDSLWQRGVLRGPAGAGRLDRRSSLAGVLLLDAKVALEAEAAAPARATVGRLADLLDDIGQLEGASRELRQIEAALAGDTVPAALGARLSSLEPALEERLLPGWLDLGRWAESVRLAAAVRSPELFTDRRGRARLRRLRTLAAGLDPETLAALEELDAFYASPPSAESEWSAFSSRLEQLLVHATP